MNNMKSKTIKQKLIKANVPQELHDKFHNRCEKIYGNKRSGTIIVRKLLLKFLAGEIKL